jgi:hypothetical protein
MIDLNHGSGCLYGADAPRPPIAEAVSAAIDTALSARHRAERPRTYVSSSGLGRDCLRQIQYDFLAVPKDEGQEFAPRTLRIFEAGHRAEDIVAGWFRIAGFDLRTERPDGRQFGFEALGGRFKGHIDGCFVSGPVAMDYPALWENKALGAASWKDVVKRGVSLARPVYAAQIALYQAYMELPARGAFHRVEPRHDGTARRARALRCASRAGNVRSRRRRGASLRGRGMAAARGGRAHGGPLPGWHGRRQVARALRMG